MSNPRPPNGKTIAEAILRFETSKSADHDRSAAHSIPINIGGVRLRIADLLIFTSHRELRRAARRLARAYLELHEARSREMTELRASNTIVNAEYRHAALRDEENDKLTRGLFAANEEIRRLKNDVTVAKTLANHPRPEELLLREQLATAQNDCDEYRKLQTDAHHRLHSITEARDLQSVVEAKLRKDIEEAVTVVARLGNEAGTYRDVNKLLQVKLVESSEVVAEGKKLVAKLVDEKNEMYFEKQKLEKEIAGAYQTEASLREAHGVLFRANESLKLDVRTRGEEITRLNGELARDRSPADRRA